MPLLPHLQLLVCLIVSAGVVSANALVISLFRRSPRLLRAPSNLLLLCLAVADMAPGLALAPVSVGMAVAAAAAAAHSTNGSNVTDHLTETSSAVACRLPFALMIACEVCSMLFVVAIALDKVSNLELLS